MVLVLLVAVGAGGCDSGTGAGTPDLRGYYTQQLTWRTCGAQGLTDSALRDLGEAANSATLAAMECARLTVPRDYARPAAGDLKLALSRFRARSGGARIGSLVPNFGGPGTPGIDQLGAEIDSTFAGLRASFDLIGMDPRGWGQSEPVTCTGSGDAAGATSGTGAGASAGLGAGAAADDPLAQLQRVAADRTARARGCQVRSGALLPYVGTVDSARDLDVLRAALGDRKLNFLGFSYGSRLGAVYAHQFPSLVGRMSLDGIIDPSLDYAGTAVSLVQAEEQGVGNFLADCLRRGPADCPFSGDQGEARGQLQQAFDAVAAKPVESTEGTLDRGVFQSALSRAVWDTGSWPDLRAALTALIRDQDAGPLAKLGGATPPAGASSASWVAPAVADPPGDNASAIYTAVECRDTAGRYSPPQAVAATTEFLAASSLFGPGAESSLLDCSGWPVRGDDTWRDVSAKGAPPVLMVGTRTDPATPYPGMARMATATGVGVVLTYAGQGHIAYRLSDCVRRAEDAFLTSGTLPKPGTVCPAE